MALWHSLIVEFLFILFFFVGNFGEVSDEEEQRELVTNYFIHSFLILL